MNNRQLEQKWQSPRFGNNGPIDSYGFGRWSSVQFSNGVIEHLKLHRRKTRDNGSRRKDDSVKSPEIKREDRGTQSRRVTRTVAHTRLVSRTCREPRNFEQVSLAHMYGARGAYAQVTARSAVMHTRVRTCIARHARAKLRGAVAARERGRDRGKAKGTNALPFSRRLPNRKRISRAARRRG